jgi:GTPase SAR1 family protein
MRRLSIATAHAFLLVYSTCSIASFECVKRCFEELREQRTDFQVILLSNSSAYMYARFQVHEYYYIYEIYFIIFNIWNNLRNQLS